MTDNHPITPPPELVEQWRTAPEHASDKELLRMVTMTTTRLREIADQAAQYGADQELEACCELVTNATVIPLDSGQWLYSRRRPKPPSLKKQALHALLHIDQGQHNERCHIIRRALEQLDD